MARPNQIADARVLQVKHGCLVRDHLGETLQSKGATVQARPQVLQQRSSFVDVVEARRHGALEVACELSAQLLSEDV